MRAHIDVTALARMCQIPLLPLYTSESNWFLPMPPIQSKSHWLWPLGLTLLSVVGLRAPAHSLHRAARDGYPFSATDIASAPIGQIPFRALPAEAQAVALSICHRGQKPHADLHDGTIFYNVENRLPSRRLGYYHEYTVPTPGLSERGARRIIVGGIPPQVGYYTADHYRTFRRFPLPALQFCRA